MENPFVKIRKELGKRIDKDEITPSELAKLAGISMNTIYNLENGSIRTINEQLLNTLKELGFNPKTIEQDYQKWLEDERQKELKRFKK